MGCEVQFELGVKGMLYFAECCVYGFGFPKSLSLFFERVLALDPKPSKSLTLNVPVVALSLIALLRTCMHASVQQDAQIHHTYARHEDT